ncbi:glycosyltransferase family 4 protein [Halosimplex sp. TS25]|uniref:glycosyltransferase family 4 protein n=1 Tax=Halosimplex rarum TaxID=3396619 RepID=UPI0039EB1B53
MRIGFYHESAGERESGGIAVFVREMAIELADTFDVTLYTRECDPVPKLRESAVDVVQIPIPGHEEAIRTAVSKVTPLNRQNVSKLLMFYAARRDGYLDHIDRNVDLLLTSQWFDDVLLSNATETPTAYEFHGCPNIGLGVKTRNRFSDAEYTLVNSHHTAIRIRHEFGISVDEVVYPGVDVDEYHPDVEPEFEHDEPAVLYVGRVTEPKGIFDLLRAFGPLADDATLHVVGRGDYERAREIADSLGIADAVVFEGVVPEEALPGYYTAADVYCLPSHYEGLGMGNIEAMACGTPVVTTNVGGVPEYATHEESALLSPPHSIERIRANLERLLADPTLRERLGREGREVAERFAWERQAETLASFCERVVEADRGIERDGQTRARPAPDVSPMPE